MHITWCGEWQCVWQVAASGSITWDTSVVQALGHVVGLAPSASWSTLANGGAVCVPYAARV